MNEADRRFLRRIRWKLAFFIVAVMLLTCVRLHAETTGVCQTAHSDGLGANTNRSLYAAQVAYQGKVPKMDTATILQELDNDPSQVRTMTVFADLDRVDAVVVLRKSLEVGFRSTESQGFISGVGTVTVVQACHYRPGTETGFFSDLWSRTTTKPVRLGLLGVMFEFYRKWKGEEPDQYLGLIMGGCLRERAENVEVIREAIQQIADKEHRKRIEGVLNGLLKKDDEVDPFRSYR